MSSAGQQLVAGRIPGERIATQIETADSTTFTTTEVTITSISAPVVTGRTYRVRLATAFQSDTAGPPVVTFIREDSATGNQLNVRQSIIDTASGFGWHHVNEVEYTADATESKAFFVTAKRNGGSGTLNMHASAAAPTYLYVDYIRG